MKKSYRVAVVGATGAVGQVLLSILQERGFPVSELLLFASKRSQGKEIIWQEQLIPCRVLEPHCFNGVDFAFFDASDAVSKEWVPQAAQAGAWVIDNSATFRMHEDVLLLVPEVNGFLLHEKIQRFAQNAMHSKDRIVSGPNCSTVQMVLVLKVLEEFWGLKRVIVSTYQSTSGAGAEAVNELRQQTQDDLRGHSLTSHVFHYPIAFNCIPQIGEFQSNGYTSEECKMITESRKILRKSDLKITATAIRVPSILSHAESINVELEKSFDLSEIRKKFSEQEGILVLDDTSKNLYPMAIQARGQDAVYVGRIRRDESAENSLNLWVVSDNLRKGAALNAVQIGEEILSALSDLHGIV
jgi:aspartate-semialdehyde dehydrogenase